MAILAYRHVWPTGTGQFEEGVGSRRWLSEAPTIPPTYALDEGIWLPVAVLTIVALWFVNRRPAQSSNAKKMTEAEASAIVNATDKEARELLIKTLNAWMFGDPVEKCEKDNNLKLRIIDVAPLFDEFKTTLVKHEITGNRQIEIKEPPLDVDFNSYLKFLINENPGVNWQHHEFATLLTFRTKGGEERKSERLYHVMKKIPPETGWIIECRDTASPDRGR